MSYRTKSRKPLSRVCSHGAPGEFVPVVVLDPVLAVEVFVPVQGVVEVEAVAVKANVAFVLIVVFMLVRVAVHAVGLPAGRGAAVFGGADVVVPDVDDDDVVVTVRRSGPANLAWYFRQCLAYSRAQSRPPLQVEGQPHGCRRVTGCRPWPSVVKRAVLLNHRGRAARPPGMPLDRR